MGTMELLASPTTIAPILLRNLVSSIFVFFDNSLLSLSQNHRLIELIRSLLLSSFLFFLSLLPSLTNKNDNKFSKNDVVPHAAKTTRPTTISAPGEGDSGIARALSQLLSLTSEIPVSSRKYDVVRSLAEKVINDNEKEGLTALSEVNRTTLSAAFQRTLSQLVTVVDVGADDVARGGTGPAGWCRAAIRAGWGRVGRGGAAGDVGPAGRWSAEKLAAELLWLARTMAACGVGEEAVRMWAPAADLARLAGSAEPRLQCSLVKLSAFLFKQGKEMGEKEGEDENQMKVKMLQSWLPLMCRDINGTDTPVLSSGERSELERVLEETIETLREDQQEKVLTIWLHHFSLCSSSDWPNLHAPYARWCDASRKTLINNKC